MWNTKISVRSIWNILIWYVKQKYYFVIIINTYFSFKFIISFYLFLRSFFFYRKSMQLKNRCDYPALLNYNSPFFIEFICLYKWNSLFSRLWKWVVGVRESLLCTRHHKNNMGRYRCKHIIYVRMILNLKTFQVIKFIVFFSKIINQLCNSEYIKLLIWNKMLSVYGCCADT